MDNKNTIRGIFILSTKLKRLLDKKHQKNGLYSGQARILMFLHRNKDEKIYQKDIENAFQIRGGTVTGMIDSLANVDYIKRVESDTDKRKRMIVLTSLGEEAALKAIETTLNLENGLKGQFSQKEIEIFNNIFFKINKWVDEEENA